jgi:hypothetical protein
MYAPGIAIKTDTSIETTACHNVNQIRLAVFDSKSSPNQFPESPRTTTSEIGQ